MTLWVWELERRAVLELGDGDSALELVMYFEPDAELEAERLRAAWVLSQGGRFLRWAAVGSA